jgi:hypothetical protein
MIETAHPLAARREGRPSRRERTIINFATAPGFRHTAALGHFNEARLAEICLNAEKTGTAIETAAAGPKR